MPGRPWRSRGGTARSTSTARGGSSPRTAELPPPPKRTPLSPPWSRAPAVPALHASPCWRVMAMRTRTEEVPPRQQDRDRQPDRARHDEPRNFETRVNEIGVNDDALFDESGEPIEDEEINTHGSQR